MGYTGSLGFFLVLYRCHVGFYRVMWGVRSLKGIILGDYGLYGVL